MAGKCWSHNLIQHLSDFRALILNYQKKKRKKKKKRKYLLYERKIQGIQRLILDIYESL